MRAHVHTIHAAARIVIAKFLRSIVARERERANGPKAEKVRCWTLSLRLGNSPSYLATDLSATPVHLERFGYPLSPSIVSGIMGSTCHLTAVIALFLLRAATLHAHREHKVYRSISGFARTLPPPPFPLPLVAPRL